MQTAEQPHIDYRQLYEQQIAVIEKQAQQIEAHFDKIAALSAEVAKLRKMIFGVRTERFIPSPDATPAELQLALDLNVETVARCKITSATTVEYVRTKVGLIPAKPKAHPGRMKLPEHLRREIILLKPDSDVSGLQKIGEDVTEILDYIPSELYVRQFIRPKYAAPLSEGGNTVLAAALPGRLLEKCMAGEGLLAQM
ncbi:MAG: IS66 family transposase zinc-finger binding domain-containing protein, partial [Bacteroidota bacterium]|nr:IS66 family transposase zinc-finger binding domain-containing protein [Bacteroidota bacterium]MDP4252222.1 IS66 family transposase zinc-finger binding domain-containing protein [Bacteroidota bacterium]